jgi:hypothetical protein
VLVPVLVLVAAAVVGEKEAVEGYLWARLGEARVFLFFSKQTEDERPGSDALRR